MSVVIRTKRVELRPVDVAAACALTAGRQLDGSAWAEGYPTAMTHDFVARICERDRRNLDAGPFASFQVVRRTDGHVVGDCGFHDAPDPDGVVVVAFAMAVSARNRGYEAEALEALIGFAFTLDEVASVRASADRNDPDTRGVLEQAGMMAVGESAGRLHFEA